LPCHGRDIIGREFVSDGRACWIALTHCSAAFAGERPKQRQPEISLAKKLLDWRPRIPSKEGLVKTIEYFEKLLADQNLKDQLLNEVAG
jgi:nucleoside-diphosphate-sugar epimerase